MLHKLGLRRGSEGIFQMMRYSSGRVVHTGLMRFVTFLYHADTRASKVVSLSSDSSSELYSGAIRMLADSEWEV